MTTRAEGTKAVRRRERRTPVTLVSFIAGASRATTRHHADRSAPDALVPRLLRARCVLPHFLVNRRELPPRQVRQRSGLRLMTRIERSAVRLRLGTLERSLEGVSEHVASLEVLPVAGLLEHQVFGEMAGVVSHVQAGERYRHRSAEARAARPRDRSSSALVEPKHAELPQLLVRERVGSTRIAPAHVPDILGQDGAAVLFLVHALEDGLVEGGKLALD